MKRNIIIFGATGKTGLQICSELNSRNITTSAFVRGESSGKLNPEGMRIIKGDVLELKDVKAAFEKETYTDVIIVLGSKALKNSFVRSKGTENIIKSMELGHTKSKIHLISALGVGDSWSQLKWHAKLLSNVLLKSVMEDHHKQEEFVTNSPFQYHIIRPVGLKDGKSLGEVHVQPEGFLPVSTVIRADVAKYLVDSLVEDRSGTSAICQKK